MWVCPKCGREFKRTNQGHYCGKAPVTVEEYIELQPAETQIHLKKIVDAIRGNVPELKERIAWSMPVFETPGCSISLSACKSHISLYVGSEVISKFQTELSEFVTKKDAVYFPYNKELPIEMIRNMIRHCLL